MFVIIFTDFHLILFPNKLKISIQSLKIFLDSSKFQFFMESCFVCDLKPISEYFHPLPNKRILLQSSVGILFNTQARIQLKTYALTVFARNLFNIYRWRSLGLNLKRILLQSQLGIHLTRVVKFNLKQMLLQYLLTIRLHLQVTQPRSQLKANSFIIIVYTPVSYLYSYHRLEFNLKINPWQPTFSNS